MHMPLCICSLIPTLATRTRLMLLVHYREARKPTTTGLLAVESMQRSTAVVIGEGSANQAPIPAPDILSMIKPHEHALFLYPADDAVPIETFAKQYPTQHPVLIVPDGSWRQASKMRHRIPGLASVPCVTLPSDDVGTTYRLRNEPKVGGLATLEAIARALWFLESDDHSSLALQKIFTCMVERTLWLRGQLPTQKVSNGIPAEAIEFYQQRSEANKFVAQPPRQ
jgi:DTW domain-containing protein